MHTEGIMSFLESVKLDPTDLIVGYIYFLMDAKSST